MGDHANDLRDQRDLMADKLSKIANITVVETEAGYNISLGGQPLVEGGEVTATVDGAFLNNAYASGTLKGGEAYGMIFPIIPMLPITRNSSMIWRALLLQVTLKLQCQLAPIFLRAQC